MVEISIVLIGVMVLTGNFLQYLLHSRCSKIETPCFKIERDVVSDDKINNETIKIKEL